MCIGLVTSASKITGGSHIMTLVTCSKKEKSLGVLRVWTLKAPNNQKWQLALNVFLGQKLTCQLPAQTKSNWLSNLFSLIFP